MSASVLRCGEPAEMAFRVGSRTEIRACLRHLASVRAHIGPAPDDPAQAVYWCRTCSSQECAACTAHFFEETGQVEGFDLALETEGWEMAPDRAKEIEELIYELAEVLDREGWS